MGSVELAYRYFGGEGRAPLVILHGLMGSSRNWQGVGKLLATDFEVFALDLRNHGDSPHADEMSYAAMERDLEAWRQRQGLERFLLLGHSLGGKVAMRYACHFPQRVAALVVADIAPRAYAPHYAAELDALAALDLKTLSSRGDAEAALEATIPDWALRKFLLTNLVREPDQGFRWQCHLPALRAALPDLAGDSLPDGCSYRGPVLFVRGARSPFVLDGDRDIMAERFPNYLLSTIAEAGHNVHHDRPEAFRSALGFFFERQRVS